MIIQFSFWDIDEITASGSEIASNIISRKASLAPLRVEVANLKDATTAREAYVTKARASGKCGRVLTHKPYQPGRAFSGFLKFEGQSILVNREVGLNETV